MRIAIFGTGGVGGYFGGRLSQSGQDVVFIARGDHLKAMLNDGLRVDSVKGDFVVNPVQAVAHPERAGVVDVIILGVKTWQVEDAAEAMRPMIGPQTVVLPLQNGVDTPDRLAAVLGRQHVLGGIFRKRTGWRDHIIAERHNCGQTIRIRRMDRRGSTHRQRKGSGHSAAFIHLS